MSNTNIINSSTFHADDDLGNNLNNQINKIKSQKILYSFILYNEKEDEKFFVALDIENFLYIWNIKSNIVKVLSNIDEFDDFQKQEIFPSLIIDINFFIKKLNKIRKNEKLFITNFKKFDTNEKLIFLSGNFDTIIFKSEKFIEKISLLIKQKNTNLNNFKKLDMYYQSLLDETENADENNFGNLIKLNF